MTPSQLPPEATTLLERAREARANAYAPYSGFAVGAALLADDGRIFTGCNVENASFGLTVCAERVALGTAVAEGARTFRAIAVCGPDESCPCPPCGACRQALAEFSPALEVITDDGANPRSTPLLELLPGAFTAEQLRSAAA